MSDPAQLGRARGRGRATGRGQQQAQQQQQPAQPVRRPGETHQGPPAAPAAAQQAAGPAAYPQKHAYGRASTRGAATGGHDPVGALQSRVAGMTIHEGAGSGERVPTEAGQRGGYRGFRVEKATVLRPAHVNDKTGNAGNAVTLMANYFQVVNTPDWQIYQYRVDFSPEIEGIGMRKKLVAMQKEVIGNGYIFDGSSFFSSNRFHQLPLELFSARETDNEPIRVTFKMTNEWNAKDPTVLQIFNILMRKMMYSMEYKLLGRQFYDSKAAASIPRHRLELWPGIITAIHQHENNLLMCCDLSFKVLRQDSVLDLLYDIYNKDPHHFQEIASKQLLGSIVLTKYNNKTYRMDDIDWNKNPSFSFEMKNGTVQTLVQYYQSQWGIKVEDMDQPLLVSRPRRKEQDGQVGGPIFLLPELCTMTGLTDEMRSDFNVMRDLATHTRAPPDKRVQSLMEFINRVTSNDKVKEDMANWGLQFAKKLIEFPGRLLPPETLFQGSSSYSYRADTADWSQEMRSLEMHSAKKLGKWSILVPSRLQQAADAFVQTMFRVCPKMGMKLSNPDIVTLPDDRIPSYTENIRKILTPQHDLLVCIVPNNRKDRYDAIKKLCCLDMPVASQVILAKNLQDQRKLMSVTTKIGVQINCKLGGEAWALEIPLKGLMVVGYDSYHDSSQKGLSVGAVCCSINQSLTRYHSSVAFQTNRQELLDGFYSSFKAGLQRFFEENKKIPDRIIVYRDGVSDGQINVVKEYEIAQMKRVFNDLGLECSPKLTVIVVNKRINTRIFMKQGRSVNNPTPGTIVDSEITRPERYDFFIVSQSVRQGTVSPTQYVVIEDSSGLKPDHLQRLTYKMTHLYFNWQGTVRVPAPCQYAHKLAFLTGQSLHKESHRKLADTLFFL